MKKLLSVLLALVMLFGCFSMVASAAVTNGEWVPVSKDIDGKDIYQYKLYGECTCENADHFNAEKCHCCVFCPNLDDSYLTKCATENNENGETGFDGTVCCEECTGIWPCNCPCACCGEKDQDLEDNKNNIGDIWDEQDQQDFISAFQAILKKISDAFDKFFDAIFAFLRIDEVLGRTE